jgi:murein L,D-transpeptidase YcbB/YkuD
MTVLRGALLALLLCFGVFSAAIASPQAAIAAMRGQQATEWQGTVVDLNLVGLYYANPANGMIWVSNGRPTKAAADLIKAIGLASEDGLDEADYVTTALMLPQRITGDKDAAGFELAMSQAFLSFARDLHGGQTSPAAASASDIVIARKPVDPAAWLSLARDKGVSAALDRLRPKHPQYFQLRQMLMGYRSLAERGGWPSIAMGPALKPGMRAARVGQMRANLEARGYSGIDAGDADLYDGNIVAVVQHFQKRHGLEPDGVAAQATIAALNVTADQRVKQIIVNLERWRWLPDDLGSRHVFVNQAGFEMFLANDGQVVSRHRVIVGKPFHKTPMFSDRIAFVEFNPSWTVTPDIATNEILPKLREDPGYLERNDYVLYGGWDASAPVIDPWSVDWHAISGSAFPYRIVQKPGPKNALGVVKFMFPNKFNIYLHDTPSRQLFAQTGRAFSHGCIRVHEPIKFAEELLGLDGSQTPDGIRSLIDAGKTVTVGLKTKVPVHLAYFTVWIDEDGSPSFFPDVYDRDELVTRLLSGEV